MVVVKVRETYDLKTVHDKMTVIGIHTPNPDIIKRNFPGLLLQCKAYRPLSCDVRIACASVLPLDPLGVGDTENAVSPEDVFNPILYKAISNKGMSMLEERINRLANVAGDTADLYGNSAVVDSDNISSYPDHFSIYYGLLADAHGWRHANPQAGLEMNGLKPLVYDVVATQGDMQAVGTGPYVNQALVKANGDKDIIATPFFLGKPKEMPFINCTAYSLTVGDTTTGYADPGFDIDPRNCETTVPWVKIICGAIIIPPSRSHELFFRMVCEWSIEFSSIRTIGEIANFNGIAAIGQYSHFQNYSYESSKKVLTGDDKSILDKSDTCMVSANVDLNKVM